MPEADSDTINWVAPLLISAGGPDVVIPEGLLDAWTGYAGDDYETACRVGGQAILGEMPGQPVWVLGGTAGAVGVGNVGGDVVILRIVTAPEKFKLPDRWSEIPSGKAGPAVSSREAGDGLVMAAACLGDSVYESDAVNVRFSQGSVMQSRRVTTPAGGDYLIYRLSRASAHGADLRPWIAARVMAFEHKEGAF